MHQLAFSDCYMSSSLCGSQALSKNIPLDNLRLQAGCIHPSAQKLALPSSLLSRRLQERLLSQVNCATQSCRLVHSLLILCFGHLLRQHNCVFRKEISVHKCNSMISCCMNEQLQQQRHARLTVSLCSVCATHPYMIRHPQASACHVSKAQHG